MTGNFTLFGAAGRRRRALVRALRGRRARSVRSSSATSTWDIWIFLVQPTGEIEVLAPA